MNNLNFFFNFGLNIKLLFSLKRKKVFDYKCLLNLNQLAKFHVISVQMLENSETKIS